MAFFDEVPVPMGEANKIWIEAPFDRYTEVQDGPYQGLKYHPDIAVCAERDPYHSNLQGTRLTYIGLETDESPRAVDER